MQYVVLQYEFQDGRRLELKFFGLTAKELQCYLSAGWALVDVG